MLALVTQLTAFSPPAADTALLFASFGDVESCACVDSYFPNALAKLVSYEIPVPRVLDPEVGRAVWKAARNETFAQYHAIDPVNCNTSFQVHATAQAEAVAAVVQAMRPTEHVRAFTGYNFVHGPGCPVNVTVADQARAALAAGVKRILVVNQNNAQASNTSIGVAYEDLAPVISSDEWKGVEVLGLDDYSQLSGFNELLISYLEAQFAATLGREGVAANQTCMVLACHGNPSRIKRQGDPGEDFMRKNYAAVAAHFETQGFNVSLAFQNHGGKGQKFPQNLFGWSSPPDTEVVPQVAEAPCTHVLISGIVSFVVDNSETLFDEAIDDRRMLAGKPAVVTPIFNAEPTFAHFLGGVIDAALNGSVPTRMLRPAHR